jgi:hypothetical protein
MRNGVVAEAAPRVTTGDPSEREPQAARRAMHFDGLYSVDGAGRRKAACATGQRRNANLIGAYERDRERVNHAARPMVWRDRPRLVLLPVGVHPVGLFGAG